MRVFVFMLVHMERLMMVAGPLFMVVSMFMAVLVAVFAMLMVFLFEVNIELGARDGSAFLSGNMEMISANGKLAQFLLEAMEIQSQIEDRAQEHVAADSAENVQIQSLHDNSPAASMLIWLAA
jgi:hypothetical protein